MPGGIADEPEAPTLVLIALLAIGGLGVWLVVAHSLWEQPSETPTAIDPACKNAATLLTLLLGLAFSYLVLYVAVLASMALVVPDQVLASTLGRRCRSSDITSAVVLVRHLDGDGGRRDRLGLETDEEVRDTISREQALVSERGPVVNGLLTLKAPTRIELV